MKKRLFPLVLWLLTIFPTDIWAEEGAHAEKGIPFSLVYAAINFFILIALLVFFLKKPAQEFFASRATLIRTNLEQSAQLKTHAEKKYAEYEARLKGIEAESKKLIDSLKQDGEFERKRIIQSAQEQVVSLKSTSEKILAQELRKAKEELKKETVRLASELAEKLIKENLTAQDQTRIVEQYLQKMEKIA